MAQAKEQYLKTREEYHLKVPRVPRQSVDVFARDIENGNYGLSSEKVDTIFSYLTLQETLDSFKDLRFSPEFLSRMPEELRQKLGDNLSPRIALSDLEIPTTDKVLLAQMLAADKLTEALSQSPVEVWVNPQIQKELEELGQNYSPGLQTIDYSELDLETKQYLVDIMEHQEHQVHTILVARQRFPEGVPAQIATLSSLFSPNMEKTGFAKLTDFETQYKVAHQLLENPFLLWYSDFLAKKEEEGNAKPRSGEKENVSEQDSDFLDDFPINVEQEARGDWWNPDTYGYAYSLERLSKIADYLRPKYRNKSIYEIMEAGSQEEQEEILSAFWRTTGLKVIDFGDEPWMIDALYLKKDGTLENHFQDDFSEKDIHTVTGHIEHYREVAMVDQTVKWIKEEMLDSESVKQAWAKKELSSNQTLEVTLADALSIDRNSEIEGSIASLPNWLKDALKHESKYYFSLIRFTTHYDIGDLFSLLMPKRKVKQNVLKSYFDRSNSKLERNRRLIVNPSEFYQDLDLDPSATQEEVKRAYRRIAKETKAIHVDSPDQFDPEDWKAMNDRFMRATKAYTAISNSRPGERRVTTLGKITQFFQN